MMVEDDDDVQKLFEYQMSALGWRVIQARTWREAVHLLVQKRPHLIIMDIALETEDEAENAEASQLSRSGPVSGIDLTRFVRRVVGSPPPVIVYSAFPDKAATAMEAGAAAFVRKPASFVVLLAAMRRQLFKKPGAFSTAERGEEA